MSSLEKCDIRCLPVENLPKSDGPKSPVNSNPWNNPRSPINNSIISYLQLESVKKEFIISTQMFEAKKTYTMHKQIKELTILQCLYEYMCQI